MKTQFTFCLLFAFCFDAAIETKAQVNKSDSLALVDLYNSTNGPGWVYHNNWLTGPVNDWYGIDLTNNGNRVASIDLHKNNLNGFMPSSLGNLSSLRYLALNNNQLSGEVIPQLGNISTLQYLALNLNQLSGNIPPELGNLSNLIGLNLSNNQLSGNIPSELGDLSNLSSLNLFRNKLSGSIPPGLGNLSSLRSLFLGGNHLSGPIPPELGKLSNLEYLVLSYNHLQGNIPSEISKLTRLSLLYLDNNKLSGGIPPELGTLSISGVICILDLSNNQLSGNIPPELGNLSFDSYFGNTINLSHNQLSGNIPPELGNLSFRVYTDHWDNNNIDLSYNQLSGAFPPELGRFFRYVNLSLNNNRFTFDGMELVAQIFPSAKYSPQAMIRLHSNNNALSVSAGGTLAYNTYHWFKKGQSGYTTIAGDSVFHPTESGLYYVRVSNQIATKLTLTSYPVWYKAPVSSDVIASNKQQDFLNNSFTVYPNPAKDILHVTTNSNASFSLVSEDGKILLTSTIDKAGVINISNVATGVYYLKNNNTSASQKIVVIK